MDTWLTQLLSGANGRHFRDDELYRLLAYIESLPEKLETSRIVFEQKDFLQKSLVKSFPDLASNKPFLNDIVDMTQIISHAMMLDDLSVLENIMGERIYSLLVRMECGMTLTNLWSAVEELLMQKLPASSKQILEPYLNWVRTATVSIQEETLATV